jgi:hypothetical protein
VITRKEITAIGAGGALVAALISWSEFRDAPLQRRLEKLETDVHRLEGVLIEAGARER